jgi:hypothetical protein
VGRLRKGMKKLAAVWLSVSWLGPADALGVSDEVGVFAEAYCTASSGRCLWWCGAGRIRGRIWWGWGRTSQVMRGLPNTPGRPLYALRSASVFFGDGICCSGLLSAHLVSMTSPHVHSKTGQIMSAAFLGDHRE